MQTTRIFSFIVLAAAAGCGQDGSTLKSQSVARPAAVERNQALQKELEEIYAADQGVRQNARAVLEKYGHKSPQMDSLNQQMQRMDAQNLPRVTAMIDRYGWPGNHLVGADGSTTAFLVIQHSDLATMQKYVPLMRAAAAKGELSYADLALVEDRILTYQHKPQRYGSQLQSNPQTGKMEFLPIEDEAQVDERRARMGMGPIAGYAQSFGLNYKPRKK